MSELADAPVVLTPAAVWGAHQSGLRIYYAALSYLGFSYPSPLNTEQHTELGRWVYYMCEQRTRSEVLS